MQQAQHGFSVGERKHGSSRLGVHVAAQARCQQMLYCCTYR
jgi:hypothetical protein